MGITFDVRSVTRHPLDRKGPPQLDARRQVILEHIQQDFAWERIPWQEPVAIGVCDCEHSASYSRWYAVHRIAQTLEMLHADAADGLDLLAEQLIRTPLTLQVEVANAVVFPHLLSGKVEEAYWLPIAFDAPYVFVLNAQIDIEETILVGSAFHLERELGELSTILKMVTARVGVDAVVGSDIKAPVTWGSVWELTDVMHTCVTEGVSRNLPFVVTS